MPNLTSPVETFPGLNLYFNGVNKTHWLTDGELLTIDYTGDKVDISCCIQIGASGRNITFDSFFNKHNKKRFVLAPSVKRHCNNHTLVALSGTGRVVVWDDKKEPSAQSRTVFIVGE